MNIEEFREYCLHFPAVTEEAPFGPDNLVYKVKGKMFALCGIDDFGSVNLKVDPEHGDLLKEQYPQITGAYHMNKKHWISVELEGLSHSFIRELIRNSYELVRKGLTKKLQKEIELGI
jgi:predicted DNA-binding protein (MmcQ/YjbR family)